MAAAAAAALAYSFAKVRAMVTALQPVKALATTAGNITSGLKRVLTPQGEKTVMKMGIAASLIFSAQMFNFPVSSGTSGHLIGGVFAAVILGPFAGAIVIAAVLLIQALFFADGGLVVLGANIVNMSLIATIGCYYVYSFIKRYSPEWIAIASAAWLSVVLASAMAALQIGLSGTVELGTVMKAMVSVHAVIGIAEAAISLLLVGLFRTFLKGE